MRQNIELKARLDDLPAARCVAESLATQRLGIQEQTDTYFRCTNGRLKLRQIGGQSAQLIWYLRPSDPRPKASDYYLVPAPQPETLIAALRAAMGVVNVVRKRREIYLWHNVRIHLDDVEGLGQFLEFEAVLSPEIDAAAGRQQLEQLTAQFRIRPGDLLAGSYTDMSPKAASDE
jgi:adenylate cyclase, class 2